MFQCHQHRTRFHQVQAEQAQRQRSTGWVPDGHQLNPRSFEFIQVGELLKTEHLDAVALTAGHRQWIGNCDVTGGISAPPVFSLLTLSVEFSEGGVAFVLMASCRGVRVWLSWVASALPPVSPVVAAVVA